MEYSENGNPPYARLARIESIALRDVNGNVMVKFRMLYRPEETEIVTSLALIKIQRSYHLEAQPNAGFEP
ncbi:hypothetical protein Tco_0061916, partial [Tanacetum coccineum]